MLSHVHLHHTTWSLLLHTLAHFRCRMAQGRLGCQLGASLREWHGSVLCSAYVQVAPCLCTCFACKAGTVLLYARALWRRACVHCARRMYIFVRITHCCGDDAMQRLRPCTAWHCSKLAIYVWHTNTCTLSTWLIQLYIALVTIWCVAFMSSMHLTRCLHSTAV